MAYRNKKLLEAVRGLACVNCGAHGTHAAHSNQIEHGKGTGIKASDAAIQALCPVCHAELDNGKEMSKAERREFTYRSIANTLIQLIEQGKLVVEP